MSAQAADPVKHLQDFDVYEFRRYVIKDGERQHFADRFEAYFPESFAQMGAIAAGSFLERKNSTRFTWIRGYRALDDRATVNSGFYYGPLWKEHRTLMNDMIVDNDNVLLLKPVSAAHRVAILPSVDPVSEPTGAHGIVVAQIFSVKPGSADAFARDAAPILARYLGEGVRDGGMLITVDEKNNFPQLPIRSDGPFLVWIGIVRDDAVLNDRLAPFVQQSESALEATGLLRGPPEWVVMDPTHRSRLRWLPEGK